MLRFVNETDRIKGFFSGRSIVLSKGRTIKHKRNESAVIFLFLCCLSVRGPGQTSIASAVLTKGLTVSTSPMKIPGFGDGRYRFSYQKILSQKADTSAAVFKDRAQATSFVKDVKKAFV